MCHLYSYKFTHTHTHTDERSHGVRAITNGRQQIVWTNWFSTHTPSGTHMCGQSGFFFATFKSVAHRRPNGGRGIKTHPPRWSFPSRRWTMSVFVRRAPSLTNGKGVSTVHEYMNSILVWFWRSEWILCYYWSLSAKRWDLISAASRRWICRSRDCRNLSPDFGGCR